jgi:hypothetical protein
MPQDSSTEPDTRRLLPDGSVRRGRPAPPRPAGAPPPPAGDTPSPPAAAPPAPPAPPPPGGGPEFLAAAGGAVGLGVDVEDPVVGEEGLEGGEAELAGAGEEDGEGGGHTDDLGWGELFRLKARTHGRDAHATDGAVDGAV